MSTRPTNATITNTNVPIADRPVTSKVRGVCRYYNTSRGCYAGDRCKFLHGELERLTPYDKSKVCKFYASGWCRHGDQCWFIHSQPGAESSTNSPLKEEPEEEDLCSICYDTPATFGLLVGCSHIFCLPCIKNWRGSEGKSADMIEAGTTKTCPMCRTSSRFVVPSSLFFPEGDPKKIEATERYKSSMARIKCRYFERSPRDKRYCPFGKECFYKHENGDGIPYVFERGADYYMQRHHSQRYREEFTFSDWDHGVENGMQVILAITRAMRSVHMSSRDVHRALSHAFGVDSLLGGDESAEEDEEESVVLPPETSTEQPLPESTNNSLHPWGDWPPIDVDEVVIAPVPDQEHDLDITDVSFSHTLPAPTSPPAGGAPLDPTSPVFVPSPSYLDSLRPLPPGPSGSSQGDEDDSDSANVAARSSTVQVVNLADFMRGLAEVRPSDEAPSTATPAAAEASANSAVQAEVDAQTETAVHDSDPPFMTDGRGRVVWSSTTASRARRGRATSSSAAMISHTKSAPDLTTAEECADEASQQDAAGHRSSSLSGRLLRQRSLPLVGSSTDAAMSAAEFVTDGRGRVVFANNP